MLVGGYGMARGGLPYAPAFWGASALVFAVMGWRWRQSRFCLLLVGVSLFSFGVGYWQVRSLPEPVVWADLPVREAELELRIERVFRSIDLPNVAMGLARVEDSAYQTAEELIGRRVYFSFSLPEDASPVQWGDRVRLRGVLEYQRARGGAEDFDVYLESELVAAQLRRGVLIKHSEAEDWIPRVGNVAQTRLTRQLLAGSGEAHPYGRVLGAMMLGQKWMLGLELSEAFVRSGTMHLFAVSGLHVAAVALTLALLLRLTRSPEWLAAMIGLLLLFLYVLATGAPPSAVRAYLMVFFYWMARAVLRQRESLAALVASAVAVLLWQPQQLFTAGFQLSYAVVAAILLFGLPMAASLRCQIDPWRFVPESSLSRWQLWVWGAVQKLSDTFSISLAATLGSTPLIIAYFGLLTPGALFLNLVLIPCASLAVMDGVLSVGLDLVGLPEAGAFLNRGAWVVLAFMIWLVRLVLLIPGFFLEVEWRVSGLAYAALILIFSSSILLRQPAARRWPLRWVLPPAGLVLFLIFGTVPIE